MRALIIFFTIVTLALFPSEANSSEMFRFRTFSPKGGFYHDGVIGINQDQEGFIWIMLDKDLLRFDGYEYHKYTPEFQSQSTTGEWSFRNFANDTTGRMHVLTNDAVYLYDSNSDSFIKEMDARLSNIAIDRHDKMWCLKDNTLNIIDKEAHTLTAALYDNNPVKSIHYYSFSDKHLFFGSLYTRVYMSGYDKPDKLELLYEFPRDHTITQIQEHAGKLWVLTAWHGIYMIDPDTKTISSHLQFQDEKVRTTAKTFIIDKHERIWVGTQFGLYIIDSRTGEQQFYRHSKSDPFSLTNNSIWTLFSDKHSNIWLGHFAGGLGYADLDDNLQVKTFTSSINSLNYELVSSFAEDADNIYIGMDGGGLNKLDKRSGIISQFMHDNNDSSLLYRNVKSLAVDSLKRLWVAMYRDGLAYVDLRTRKLHNFRHDAADPSSLLYNDLRKIVLDSDSGLWIAYQNINTRVSYLSFADGKFTHYDLGDNDGYIFDIQHDANGNLYALTRHGLFRVNKQSGKSDKMTGGDIAGGQSLAIDANGDVWIGTIGHGLIRYEPQSGMFSHNSDVLSTNATTIYSISQDNVTGSLWLGTDNGLVQFDVRNNTYRRFNDCDGFQGQVYYPLSVFSNRSGQMFFGGTNGFSIFTPGSITQNPRKPQARISRFYIDNQPAASSTWKTTSRIELEHDQANFGFRLSSDNYQTPEKNRFRYRLKGYDNGWITTDANDRTVTYSKVPAGNYTFEILTANNDGVWNDTPTSVQIIRHPAPWASPLAYVIYSILILLVAYGIFHYWNEKRKLKIKLFMDNLDKQQKEELHRSQLRFFTNISHDFRTPLSLILAVTDSMKQDGLKSNYHRILHNNSRRLLNLVNELMDFQTLGNKKMKLQVQQLDANALVKDMASDFDDYARKRDISFSINCDPALGQSLYIDKQVLEKIVMNLLNNSFKYTADGGEIKIETYSPASEFTSRFRYSHHIGTDRPPVNELTLVVSDSGCGITANSIKDVFERYNMVNTTNLNQHLGTGIGLALVKSLVLLHHGSISIYSERNKGTDIVVKLPTDSSAFGQDEFATDKLTDSAEIAKGSSLNNGELLALPEPDAVAADNDTDIEEYGNRKRILLVEDNDDMRTLITGFLKLHYDIIEAPDGQEAAEIIGNTSVDLIISDIMMPRKDGITLCREVKGNIDTSHIPVMLLTARSGAENQMEGIDSGADLYFSKPIDFNMLLQSVRNIFRHQHNLREYYARNYFADETKLSTNHQDTEFLNKITEVIEAHLANDNIDVNMLANELCMSRSKLYTKLKSLTGRSIVKFILNYRMRKAARLIVEQDIPLYQVMEQVGIRSQSYFVNAFKEEFGETPSAFMARHRKKDHNKSAINAL